MIFVIFFLYNLFYQIEAESLCEKLNEFGDNIQNKAILSPIIIIGKGGMKIDLQNAKYKVTIEIIKTIKGSLGSWNASVLMAGEFSTFKDSKNSCQFQSLSQIEQIYFLRVASEKTGEYRVLFDPERYNDSQMEKIRTATCQGCGKPPSIRMKDMSKSSDFLVVECTSDGNPPPVIKWKVHKNYITTIIEPIEEGLRLIQPVNNSSSEVQVCKAVNIFGSASYSISIKPITFKSPVMINRCSLEDKQFCNGNGKCYQDRSEKDSKFCRCNKEFMEPNCINASKIISNNLTVRLKHMDKKFCNNQGIALTKYGTQTMYCECYLNFFGNNCEKKYFMKTQVNEGLKDFIAEQTSKLAIKYIIIGCLIVLAGCILIVIVIVCLWRFYFKKNSKRSPEINKRSENNNYRFNNSTNNANLPKLEYLEPNKKLLNDKENRPIIPNSNSGNGIYDNNYKS